MKTKVSKAKVNKYKALLEKLEKAKTVNDKALVNTKINIFINENFLNQSDLAILRSIYENITF